MKAPTISRFAQPFFAGICIFGRTGRAGDAASQAHAATPSALTSSNPRWTYTNRCKTNLRLASRAEGLTIIVDDDAKYQQVDGWRVYHGFLRLADLGIAHCFSATRTFANAL
jgi:hypothetical protein